MVYTKSDIIKQLIKMEVPTGGLVLMHTSLRAVGQVLGGAQALLDAMIEYFTRNGGLFCVPTHTWHNLGKSITLEMDSDDTCLGAFSAVAARDKRGIRSENPTHSVVLFGDRARAESMLRGEAKAETPTAPETFYGRLYEEGGFVLLVGVAQNRNTFLHTVDEILEIPNRMGRDWTEVGIRKNTGTVISRRIRLFETDYTEDISWRFPKYETAFRYHGCITDGLIGNAPAQLCDARKMKEVVELIHRNSGGIDPLAGEEPIPQKWYCTR